MKNPASISLRIHPAGWSFVALLGLLSAVLLTYGVKFGFFFVFLTAFCAYFFRDPIRVTPTRAGLVTSPADGKVIAIQEVVPDEGLGLGDTPHLRISIFLNVFNVHVNRAPIEGTVTHRRYREGKFFNASLDKASIDNERMALALQMTGNHSQKGQKIGVVQIAGLIARRIVCSAKVDQSLQTGERFGIIRFGSRTDVYLPKGTHPLVCIGQRMLGGETVLADFLSSETARQGEAR